jgi:hypothetical protein
MSIHWVALRWDPKFERRSSFSTYFEIKSKSMANVLELERQSNAAPTGQGEKQKIDRCHRRIVGLIR